VCSQKIPTVLLTFGYTGKSSWIFHNTPLLQELKQNFIPDLSIFITFTGNYIQICYFKAEKKVICAQRHHYSLKVPTHCYLNWHTLLFFRKSLKCFRQHDNVVKFADMYFSMGASVQTCLALPPTMPSQTSLPLSWTSSYSTNILWTSHCWISFRKNTWPIKPLCTQQS